MSISLSSIITPKPNVFAAEVHGELVLFDPDKGCYYGAGPVGERIWSLMGEKRTVEGIVAAIVSEFDVDQETAKQDVLAFIVELREGAVVEVDTP
jgi:hypothetical protein